jgi:hypothetical protein
MSNQHIAARRVMQDALFNAAGVFEAAAHDLMDFRDPELVHDALTQRDRIRAAARSYSRITAHMEDQP